MENSWSQSWKDYTNKNWFLPVAFVSVLILTNAGKKLMLYGYGTYTLITRNDKKVKSLSYDPGNLINIDKSNIIKKETKTLLLYRHCESTFNLIANRKFIHWTFPFRMLYILAKELILFVINDSVLIDAPLSSLGEQQARKLSMFLNNNNDTPNEYINMLNGINVKNSIIISSPLRRCVESVFVGLQKRLDKTNEYVYLVSSLQELTSNMDGISLSKANAVPPFSYEYNAYINRIDVQYKDGYKSKCVTGDKRLNEFLNWMFLCNETKDINNIIVAGHSLYFKTLFRQYLPKTSNHDGKSNKIKNGGIVAIKLTKIQLKNDITKYYINPDSIQVVYQGFLQKKKE